MSAFLLGLALAVACPAAPVRTPDRPQDKSAEKLEGKALVEYAAVPWLKVYPLPVYRESWRLEGTVKSLSSDLPRVREAFAKVGAASVGGEEASGRSRRLSYRCPKDAAVLVLSSLRKLGKFRAPVVRQHVEPVSRAEVRDKILALEADKAGHGADLARMPAVSALVDELLGHLRGVETALSKPEVEVLVRLTVREKNGS
jgi:hypothetical protein